MSVYKVRALNWGDEYVEADSIHQAINRFERWLVLAWEEAKRDGVENGDLDDAEIEVTDVQLYIDKDLIRDTVKVK